MDNKIFNFDFGPVKGDNIRMSMYGLAVKNRDGNYVAWDKVNENIMNVDIPQVKSSYHGFAFHFRCIDRFVLIIFRYSSK